ncbi:MAG: DUF4846 domain-containing protein [Oscillospiraceae bacterium]|nr:DUF4846 domain-containing protein [Oscillospiraceae bacterium]
MLPVKKCVCLSLALIAVLSGCGWMTPPPAAESEPPPEETPEPSPPEETPEPYLVKNPEGTTIGERFNPPEGFTRAEAEEGSFAAFLRGYPLKPDGGVIYLHDGTIKPDDRFDAVLKMDIGPRDFMRNTNFLLRLRGEYLYGEGRYEDIEFHFFSGFLFPFSKWAAGERISVDGSRVDWSAPAAAPDDSPEALRNYLNTLFIYSNATAIRQDLLQAAGIEAGFVFTTTGGAVIADLAEDENGRMAVLLARGGDPEQEGYVVRNPGDRENSPWFIVPANGILQTPEGELSVGDLFLFRK